MAKVYKRKLPSGNISWVADYVDPFTGKRRRESFAKQKHAKQKLDDVISKKISGEPVDTAKVRRTTIHQLVEDYKQKCMEQDGRNHWMRNRGYAIQRFEQHFGPNTLAASIAFRHLEDYRDHLLKLPTRRGNKRAGASVNREFAQLRRLFRRGRERGFLIRDPFKDGFSLRVEEAKRDRHLSKAEFELLMAKCAPHLRVIVLAGVATGIRRGNLLALTWKQIDFDDSRIHLDETKNGNPLNIPVTESLRQVLKIVRKEQLTQHMAAGRRGKPPEHVFTYTRKVRGRMVTTAISDIKTAFKAACRRAKLENVRFHDLRHTFATCLRDAQTDMHMIGELLGHSWSTVTQRYAHENFDAKKEAISPIEGLIANVVGTYWHTPQTEAEMSTTQQASNA
jgi:integrase